jgi:hypothetical protein
MSSLAIANAASTTLPVANFHSRGSGHHKGLVTDAASPSGNSLGQIPVGGVQNLFSNLLQTLEQIIGVQPSSATPATAGAGAVSAAGTAAGTAAHAAAGSATSAASASTPAVAQDLNGFLHSLFQVLKQDGLGSGTGAATPASAGTALSTGTGASPGAGQYQGSLVSSLQTLIGQVGSTGSTNPAIANLDASFQNLVQGVSGNGASTAASSSNATSSSNAALQSFLNNLLQNLQANGLQAPKLTGSNVNANA